VEKIYKSVPYVASCLGHNVPKCRTQGLGGSFALSVSFALLNIRLPPLNISPRNLCERDHKNQKPLYNVFDTQCLKLASPD
jgi:hypothetical protein